MTGRKRSSIIEGRLADARPRAGPAAANPRGGERHSREEEARLARHLEPVAKVGFPGGAPIADAEGTLQRDAAAASRDARRRSADPTRNDLSIVSSLASAPTRGRGVAIELARPRCIPPPLRSSVSGKIGCRAGEHVRPPVSGDYERAFAPIAIPGSRAVSPGRATALATRMARRNGCTGELEYPNGCTTSGYACSAFLAATLCLGIPIAHLYFLSNASPAPLDACLARDDVTPEAHAADMSMYYRYRVENARECTIETRVLRGCVANRTKVIGFPRYPPGPLRSKNTRDVRASFEHVKDDFLAARAAPVGVGVSDTQTDPCARPGAALATHLPFLTSPPYDVSLRDVPPFSSLADDDDVSYPEFACLAAVERGLELIDEATRSNGAVGVDLSVRLASFFTSEERVRGTCRLPPEMCAGEKDTPVGHRKGSDLGLGKCDFVEYADVA